LIKSGSKSSSSITLFPVKVLIVEVILEKNPVFLTYFGPFSSSDEVKSLSS